MNSPFSNPLTMQASAFSLFKVRVTHEEILPWPFINSKFSQWHFNRLLKMRFLKTLSSLKFAEKLSAFRRETVKRFWSLSIRWLVGILKFFFPLCKSANNFHLQDFSANILIAVQNKGEILLSWRTLQLFVMLQNHKINLIKLSLCCYMKNITATWMKSALHKTQLSPFRKEVCITICKINSIFFSMWAECKLNFYIS